MYQRTRSDVVSPICLRSESYHPVDNFSAVLTIQFAFEAQSGIPIEVLSVQIRFESTETLFLGNLFEK